MRACVFSLDDSYVLAFKVFYSSLEATLSIPSNISIFVIHSASLTNEAIEDVSSFLRSYGRDCSFKDASNILPPDLPLRESDHVSVATFYRLFLASILPNYIDEAVYFDVDMLAVKSVRSLFEMPLLFPLAAADHLSLSNQLRLHGSVSGVYLQAGVIIANLLEWRQAGTEQLFLRVLSEYKDKILWHDQDVLNIAFGSAWQRISVWLNVCDTHIRFLPSCEVEMHARLIHFNGPFKPWNSLCRHPFVESWDSAYQNLFGIPFDRASFQPPLYKRIAGFLRSRLSGLFYGRYAF